MMNNLGGLYWSQGRYNDALPLYERTRGIYEKTLDPMHPNVAAILNNLGETYWKLSRYGEAETFLRQSLKIKEARLDARDPSIAITLNALAGVLRDSRRPQEAESAYRRALDIRRNAFKPGNADLAETAAELGAMNEIAISSRFLLHVGEARHDLVRSFPTAFLQLERSSPTCRDPVELGPAIVLGRSPLRTDRTLLLKLQQDRVERSLID